MNFDDGSYFSDKNFWFNSYKYETLNIRQYDRPILASNRSEIGDLQIVF